MKSRYCVFLLLFAWQCLFIAKLSAQNVAIIPIQQKRIDSINVAVRKNYLSNPYKWREQAQKALLLSKKYNYKPGVGQSFLNIGITYWGQSYYPISLFYLNSALQTFGPDDHIWRSDCYRCIGRDYVDLKKYKEGLAYIAVALKEAGNNPDEQERAISEQSYAYLRMGRYDEGIAGSYKAIALCRQMNRPADIAVIYGRLYSMYLAKKDYANATLYCDSAYRMSFKSGNKRLRTTTWVGKAAIAFELKNYTEAIKNAEVAASMADSLGIMETQAGARKWIYRCYEAMGDKEKAFAYQKKYIQLQDSLNKLDKLNSLQLIQDYFSLNSKLHHIEQIEHRNEVNTVLIRSQQGTIIYLGLAIVCLLVVLYVVYRFYQQKHTQNLEVIAKNELIETQSKNLDELNQLKDRLLAIIGHDLRSPLANVRNIVDLFGQGYFTAEEVQSLMKEMSPAIAGAELTLSNLVEWAGSQLKGNNTIVEPVDLLAVAQELNNVFGHPLAQKNIAFINEIEPGQAVLADENHVKMILRNLISNAIKFTDAAGTITLSARQQDGRLRVEVKDNGRGMTAEENARLFATNTHFSQPGTKGEKGTGIGLLLCQQLAALNGGKIGATSTPGGGSTFYITLPVAQMHLQA